MRIEIARQVQIDLKAIANYVEQDSPSRSITLMDAIKTKMVAVAENPFLYQLRPEIGGGARMALVGSYAILFRVHRSPAEEFVRMERVLYGGRDLSSILVQEE